MMFLLSNETLFICSSSLVINSATVDGGPHSPESGTIIYIFEFEAQEVGYFCSTLVKAKVASNSTELICCFVFQP